MPPFSGISLEDPLVLFQIVAKLGEGSYGSVFKAIDNRDGSVVAIKILEMQESESAEALEKEISILRTCANENIVAYKGTFESDGNLWIVMEYCDAGSVMDLMTICDKKLEEPQIAAIMKMALEGLKYLHASRKIHRDIKSGNLLLTHRGECKLADFGVSAELTNTMARRNTMIGTPFWMAPEVLQSVSYDGKADIWSLGITAYELAVGDPPNSELHPMRAIFIIPNQPPPTLPNPAAWSNDFNEFIRLCLTKNVANRPSANDLLTSCPFILKAPGRSIVADLVAECMAQIEQYRTETANEEAEDSADDEQPRKKPVANTATQTTDTIREQTEFWVALADFTMREDGQFQYLRFKEGDIIRVISTVDTDWWYGELNGVMAYFPATYVEPCSSQANRTAKPTATKATASPSPSPVSPNASSSVSPSSSASKTTNTAKPVETKAAETKAAEKKPPPEGKEVKATTLASPKSPKGPSPSPSPSPTSASTLSPRQEMKAPPSSTSATLSPNPPTSPRASSSKAPAASSPLSRASATKSPPPPSPSGSSSSSSTSSTPATTGPFSPRPPTTPKTVSKEASSTMNEGPWTGTVVPLKIPTGKPPPCTDPTRADFKGGTATLVAAVAPPTAEEDAMFGQISTRPRATWERRVTHSLFADTATLERPEVKKGLKATLKKQAFAVGVDVTKTPVHPGTLRFKNPAPDPTLVEDPEKKEVFSTLWQSALQAELDNMREARKSSATQPPAATAPVVVPVATASVAQHSPSLEVKKNTMQGRGTLLKGKVSTPLGTMKYAGPLAQAAVQAAIISAEEAKTKPKQPPRPQTKNRGVLKADLDALTETSSLLELRGGLTDLESYYRHERERLTAAHASKHDELDAAIKTAEAAEPQK